MSVAPSFESFIKLTEPYEVGGKMYIKVQNPSTGTIRQVRWYAETGTSDLPVWPLKDVLGFQEGYITIFKGNIKKEEEWFLQSIARFSTLWGWYIISTDPIPNDLPSAIKPVRLPWTAVGNEQGYLNPKEKVKKAVETIIYNDSPSEYQGKIGDRLEVTIVVTGSPQVETKYGDMTLHTFVDANGNVYEWATTSKRWEEGTMHHIRGTVKSHQILKQVKTTSLTRCVELNS